ncbi:MAG: flagellar protein [Lachnospiraceae bacterium]|nr:flagellar protein [Lachnospiraceae bacterium]
MQVINNHININQAAEQLLNRNEKTGISAENGVSGLSFQDILRGKVEAPGEEPISLKFSKHAAGRLEDRNIRMTDSQLERLTEGAVRAQMKGIKDSLVMVDSLAFIVNVPNQTVVTAMDQTETNDNIFTNIDGAVIA